MDTAPLLTADMLMSMSNAELLAWIAADRDRRTAARAEREAERRRRKGQRQLARLRATICRHCRVNPVSRPRGLCYSCYYTPGVLALYPPTSKFARRGTGNLTGCRRLPDEPTDALPGTEAKVRVLEQRAAAGVQLWHPRDAAIVVTPQNHRHVA